MDAAEDRHINNSVLNGHGKMEKGGGQKIERNVPEDRGYGGREGDEKLGRFTGLEIVLFRIWGPVRTRAFPVIRAVVVDLLVTVKRREALHLTGCHGDETLTDLPIPLSGKRERGLLGMPAASKSLVVRESLFLVCGELVASQVQNGCPCLGVVRNALVSRLKLPEPRFAHCLVCSMPAS